MSVHDGNRDAWPFSPLVGAEDCVEGFAQLGRLACIVGRETEHG